MNDIKEIWKDIPNYENSYQISNFGRVKSLNKMGCKEKILKPSNNKGYLRISLYINGKKNNFKLIHRLVALVFISNPENKPEVNHKDFDKGNNMFENLEWSTKKENMEHLMKSGKMQRFYQENAYNAKLKKIEVNQIREEYINNEFISQSILAERYGVSKSIITNIILNKSWYNEQYQQIINSDKFIKRLDSATNKGELNRTAKLKKEQILEIRWLNKCGISTFDLSLKYNVSISNLNAIIRKSIWKHI